MTLLSNFSDIFGAPRTGLHAYRLFDVAVVDLAATHVFSLILSYTNVVDLDPWKITAGLTLVSIPIHWLFGVRTKLVEMSGLL